MAFRTVQVAECLGVTTSTVQSWVARGHIKSHHHSDGKHLLFEKEDVAKFILSDRKRYLNFLNAKPKNIYHDSYNILRKEVQKQYERDRETDRKFSDARVFVNGEGE